MLPNDRTQVEGESMSYSELLGQMGTGLVQAGKAFHYDSIGAELMKCGRGLLNSARFMREVRYYVHRLSNEQAMKSAGVTGRMGC